jgi:hypothetical protein
VVEGRSSGDGDRLFSRCLRHAFAALPHLFQSRVVLNKSIPAQIRHLILYISNNEGQVKGFVQELTFAERLYKHFL